MHGLLVGLAAAAIAAALPPQERAMKLPGLIRIDDRPVLGTYAVDTAEGIAQMRAVGMNLVLGGEKHLDAADSVGKACAANNVRVLYHLTQHIYGKPRLLDRITADQKDIPLYTEGAGAFPKSGVIQLDDEVIIYEASEGARLIRCTRGAGGTRPAEHRGGTILFWPDECAAEVRRVSASSNLWGYYVLDDSPGDALSALKAMYGIVKRIDPNRIVAAGYGSAGSLCNFGPGVCDVMLIYWYPVFGSGRYAPLMTSHQVQWMVAAARQEVPGIPFFGVYQTFDAAFDRPENAGKGLPTAAQLRTQIEDFVREGASGLVAFLGGAPSLPGWTALPALRRVIADTHSEIRRTGALRVPPEPQEMKRARVFSVGYWATPKVVAGIPPAWHVVLPFGPSGGKGLDAVYPPETEIALNAQYAGKLGPVRWVVRRTYGGVVGLGELLGGHDLAAQATAYATCEIASSRRRDLLISYGSDDDMAVWLNGKEVVRRVYGGGLDRDAETAPVTIEEGVNRLLVKVHNRSGMWGFHLRFVERSGKVATDLRFSPKPPC